MNRLSSLGNHVLDDRTFGFGELSYSDGLVDGAQSTSKVWHGGIEYLSIQHQLHSAFARKETELTPSNSMVAGKKSGLPLIRKYK